MIKYGFSELSRKPLNDIGAVAVEYRHAASGARLLHLERKDVNKTFMIAFKTPPKNSTGVFHILEHSVLCGSEKYPLKEPFVELLKGSLNTFLNAMTYPDKTVYPVSSMNDKDFLNLVSVYMDAVLHPSLLECESIFLQEGHRLELNGGVPSENGVVLNEMLGAYSSPEEIEGEAVMQLLYPDSPYAYSSGGDPQCVVDLTYEEFVETYKKHYAPGGAYMVLDGDVKLDEVLPLIDGYLCKYTDKVEPIVIEKPKMPTASTLTLLYPIADGDDPADKTRMTLCMRTFSFDQREENLALAVIKGAVAATQNSPFCRAVLDSGFCEDVYISSIDEVRDGAMCICFVNVKDGCERQLLDLALGELRTYAQSGIDKDAIRSSLSSLEFITREKNYGSLPCGVVYALTAMESWLYSDDATQNLAYSDVFESLNARLDTDYYENILKAILPDEGGEIVLLLKPDAHYSERASEAERVRCLELYEKMTESERAELAERTARFNEWQSRRDTKEELECLPTLSLSDIDPIPTKTSSKRKSVGGCRTERFDIDTSGINYINIFFDTSDLTLDECADAAILSSALTKMPTELHSEGELAPYIKGNLGFMNFSPMAAIHNSGGYVNAVKLSVGVLSEKADRVADIVAEVMHKSRFKPKNLATLLGRLKLNMRENMSADGTNLAIDRAQAAFCIPSVINEYYSGYEAYLAVCDDVSSPEKTEDLAKRLSALAKRIFVRQRARIFGAGPDAERIFESIVGILPDGSVGEAVKHSPLSLGKEGIAIPSRIAFTALGFPIPKSKYTAAYETVKTVLNYEYLWNEIRAVGGAYGAGESLRDGYGAFYSYRDPSPKRSLEKYLDVPAFLDEFAKNVQEKDIEKYVIGAFSVTDGVKSARSSFDLECARSIRGISFEKRKLRRRQMLDTSREDIIAFSEMLKKQLGRAVSCTVASADILADMGDAVENINKIV